MVNVTNNYLKAKAIWLYYFGFLLFTTVIAFPTRKLAEHLEASGFKNMTVVSFLTVITLFLGVLIKGIDLLIYYDDISNLDEHDIAHVARTFYISPFVDLSIGFLAGICIWVILKFLSITVEEVSHFAIIAIILNVVSLRASNQIERLIFPDNI